jgi:hypothetical protein
MIDYERIVNECFEKALLDKLNYNDDGAVNLDYVEADCYCEMKDNLEAEFDRVKFFEVFDKICDERY